MTTRERVRTKTGAPVASDFDSPLGTPIVVDGTASTGTAYFMDDAGNIVKLARCVSWTSWTPTITASSGSITSVSATGKYALIAGLYFVRVIITITTNGTGAGVARFTLPTTAGEAAVFYGRETGVAGNQLQGSVAASSNTVDVVTYNNAYPGADGAVLTVSGFYV